MHTVTMHTLAYAEKQMYTLMYTQTHTRSRTQTPCTGPGSILCSRSGIPVTTVFILVLPPVLPRLLVILVLVLVRGPSF